MKTQYDMKMEHTIFRVICPFCGNHHIMFQLDWDSIICAVCKVDVQQEFASIEQAAEEDIDHRSELSVYVEFGNEVYYLDHSLEEGEATNRWNKDNPPNEPLEGHPEIPKYPEIAYRNSGWVNWYEFLNGGKGEDQGNGVDLLDLK